MCFALMFSLLMSGLLAYPYQQCLAGVIDCMAHVCIQVPGLYQASTEAFSAETCSAMGMGS